MECCHRFLSFFGLHTHRLLVDLRLEKIHNDVTARIAERLTQWTQQSLAGVSIELSTLELDKKNEEIYNFIIYIYYFTFSYFSKLNYLSNNFFSFKGCPWKKNIIFNDVPRMTSSYA